MFSIVKPHSCRKEERRQQDPSRFFRMANVNMGFLLSGRSIRITEFSWFFNRIVQIVQKVKIEQERL